MTGHALRLPYSVHEATYAVAPTFLWLRPHPEPTYHHQVMRDYYTGLDRYWYGKHLSITGLVEASAAKFGRLWMFYQGNRFLRSVLTIPLVMLPWVLRDRWPRFALLECGVFTAGELMVMPAFPHYAAPITSLVVVLVLQGMRHLRVWRWHGRSLGQSVVWTLAVVALASFLLGFVREVRAQPAGWAFNRARLLAQLKAEEGSHLVIVRYGPQHSPNNEWVYNEADIDGAQVVWAREMDAAHNRQLLEYFRDRHVWLMVVDEDRIPPQLLPYPLEAHP